MKKKLLALVLAVSLAASALGGGALAADDGTYSVKEYTAGPYFHLPEGTVGVYVTSCSDSFTFDLPPALPGFTFIGWKAADGDTVYQPGDVIEVTGDLTFYGQWKAAYPFTDLDRSADYFYDVISVYEQGLMNGTSDTAFSPDAPFTRAMLWTVLARMGGADIDGSGWIEQAQAWVMENGVSDGTFPSRAVTRQELVTMLYRQAGSPDTYAGSLRNLDDFPTADQVADWARDAMWWAINTEVHPRETVELDPTHALTRAEVASAVAQFCTLPQ